MGSASKLFWGGLRVGWIRAERQLLTAIVSAKNTEDLGTSVPSQLVAARLLERSAEARATRRQQMNEVHARVGALIASRFPDWHIHPSTGGASLWIRIPAGLSATVTAERARRGGVNILPGPIFSISNELNDHVRIAIANEESVVAEGIERLARACEG